MNRILRGTRTWSLRFTSLNYPVLKNTKVMISQLPASHKPFCQIEICSNAYIFCWKRSFQAYLNQYLNSTVHFTVFTMLLCNVVVYTVCIQCALCCYAAMCTLNAQCVFTILLCIKMYTVYHVVLLQCMTYVYNIQLSPCLRWLFLSGLFERCILYYTLIFTKLFYCNVWRMCTIYNYRHV